MTWVIPDSRGLVVRVGSRKISCMPTFLVNESCRIASVLAAEAARTYESKPPRNPFARKKMRSDALQSDPFRSFPHADSLRRQGSDDESHGTVLEIRHGSASRTRDEKNCRPTIRWFSRRSGR